MARPQALPENPPLLDSLAFTVLTICVAIDKALTKMDEALDGPRRADPRAR